VSKTNKPQIEHLPIESLVPYARNSRTHSPEQISQVANSIMEFGFTNPVLIDGQGGIIAGHGRVMAAKSLGLAEVPCIRLGHLSEAQKRAYVIADNKLALNAGWDEEMLALEFKALNDMGFDLELTGFDLGDIDELLAELDATPEGETDADEAPAVQAEVKTQPGDVWMLGKHRIMCGDSTDAGSVALLMDGEKADLCFTSPPYGNQRDYTTGGISDWDKLMQGVFANLPMAEHGQVLVNLGLIHRKNEWVPYWDDWIEWMRNQGWRRFGLYVWDQGFGLPGDWNGRFAPSYEFVFHFNRVSVEPQKFLEKKPENIKARNAGASTMRGKDGKCKAFTNPEASAQPNKIPESVIRINRMHGGHNIDHPAIFPVELPAHAMQSWPGVAYEPFSGSGTTIIAAEQTGRRCYAMELSPQYVDVAVRRWQQYTGKQAVHAETGQPFGE